MTERGIIGWDRKCRSCGQWTYHAGEEALTYMVSPCPFCGAEYGRLILGDDVPRHSPARPVLSKKEQAEMKAAKLAAKTAKKGQFGYRGR